MPKHGIFSANQNMIETTVAKDYAAMMAIHFAQWMAMNYAEVLNTENGIWYTEQFLHFETHVWPKWVGNGAMVDYLDILKKQQNDLVVR
jgi:hypothetical protein